MGKKSKKRSWRNADLGDVEENLGKRAAVEPTASNDDLFFEDKAGNINGQASQKRKARAKELEELTKKQQKKKQRKGGAPSTAWLATQAVSTEVEDAAPRKEPKSKSAVRFSRRSSNGKKAKAEAAALRKSRAAIKTKDINAEETLRDLWAEPSRDDLTQGMREQHGGFEVDITPKETQKFVCQRQRKGRQAAAAKSLVSTEGTRVAMAGQSFNPHEEDRQAALGVAFERDTKERQFAMDIRDKLHPALEVGSSATPVPEEDDESELRAPKKQKGMLNKAQRNKKERAAERRRQQAEAAKRKQLDKQLNRLSAVMGEIKKEERVHRERREEVAGLKETQSDHRPVVSKHEFVPEFPNVPLEEDLESRSMRMLRPSTTLLGDQFKAFQDKNIIETRKKVTGMKRRYKMKNYTRNSHKEDRSMWKTKKKS